MGSFCEMASKQVKELREYFDSKNYSKLDLYQRGFLKGHLDIIVRDENGLDGSVSAIRSVYPVCSGEQLEDSFYRFFDNEYNLDKTFLDKQKKYYIVTEPTKNYIGLDIFTSFSIIIGLNLKDVAKELK